MNQETGYLEEEKEREFEFKLPIFKVKFEQKKTSQSSEVNNYEKLTIFNFIITRQKLN